MAMSLKRVALPLIVAVGLVVSVGLVTTPVTHAANAAESAVGLGNAGSFAVLAASTVTNTGPTVVSGDLGVNAGSAVTGFSAAPTDGKVINGTIHATDTLSGLAQNDLVTAYKDAASRTPTTKGLAVLDGKILVPGVYSGGALALNGGTLTLNGTANDVFIFQATSTLKVASGSKVALLGGASACNVFWQVASSATIGTTASFVGTVMALTSISVDNAATVNGRLLARTGGVTLINDTITRPTSCVTAAVGTPATPVPGRARFTG